MRQSIRDLLPILEIDNDCILSKRGDCTLAFELVKPELFSLSTADLDKQSLVKAIPLLPFGIVLHFSDWYTSSTWQAGFGHDPDKDFLASSSDRFYHGRHHQVHRAYCFITRKSGSSRTVTSALSSLLNPTLLSEQILDPNQLQEFTDQCLQFMTILCEGGLMQSRRLTTDELAGTEEHMGLIQQYHQLIPPSQAPELRDVSLQKTGIRIGDLQTVLYSVADAEQLPAQCSSQRPYDRYSTDRTIFPVGTATALGPLLDADHIYSLLLFWDEPAPALKKLERKARRVRSLAAQDRQNAVTHEAIESYLDEAASGNQLPVRAHFNVFAWTADPAEMPQVKNRIVTAMTKMGIQPKLETVGAPQIWWAGQPGNAADFPMNDTFGTFIEVASCFLIPESYGRSSTSPFGMRFGDRYTGIPMHVDISDEPLDKKLIDARGKLLIGPTGSGKSFFCCHLIQQYFQQGAHIVVVDIGHSYKGLCELVGGRYFSYSPDQPIRFNPFRLTDGELMDVEKRESLKGLLLVLWKKSDEKFLRSEYVTLSNMLESYYSYLADYTGIFPCFDSFYEWLREHFAKQIAKEAINEQHFDLPGFLYVLRPYYRGGEFDYLLNARENIDLLHERLIIFDLEEIKDHPILFPVVTIVVMDAFIGKIRKLKGIRKVMLLDEAWKAIAKEGTAEYVRNLYKTVRKFFGEPIAVTQEIEDLVSSPVVKNTIINMSDCKILLDLSKYTNRFDEIQNLLGLTEKEKTLVLSLNKANEPGKKYKEVFISLGNKHSRVYRLETSLEEYLVYTTEEREKVKVQDYAGRFGSLRKGIIALAADIRSGTVQLLLAAVICLAFLLLPNGRASAQFFDIIDAAVKKVLMTADLEVQRLQTQTLALQNVEKNLENTLQDGLLGDITDWVQRQEDLYKGYYQELWQVKSAFSTYSKVRSLIQRQAQLVKEYNQARAAVRQDPHFSGEELAYISSVYDGLLNESIRNAGQLALVMGNFITQMDDAARLRTIDETAGRIDRNSGALRSFTQQTTLLSLQRSKDEQEIKSIQKLYGIQ